jgi:dTMP kinase
MFVTFEGVDGSGKTTQAELLRAHLAESGRDVLATREPGGTELGERIRRLLLEGAEMSPWAEAALFAAARAELVESVIAPALERGADVICDRYLDSSLAYQGIARGLGADEVLELNQRVLRGVMPDRTFLLLVDADESERRVGAKTDRIEGEGSEFRRRVDGAYRELAGRFPERIRALDGSLPAVELARLIREDVSVRV